MLRTILMIIGAIVVIGAIIRFVLIHFIKNDS